MPSERSENNTRCTLYDPWGNMEFCHNFSISVLAIQLQQYHMSFINYISLGNTNMNIIRCKMQCLIESPLPGCAKLLLFIQFIIVLQTHPAANETHVLGDFKSLERGFT